MSESDNITKKAKSNLAFTLVNLNEETRQHMAQFYAFCRLVDDIVDEPGMNKDERHRALDRWEQVIQHPELASDKIEEEVAGLVEKLQLDLVPMLQLIEGCRGDIEHQQPENREDLLSYAYQVAACVGITSAHVMGASTKAQPYAIALGYALQFVNIIRDVSQDYQEHKRIYLPKADMKLFGVTEEQLAEKQHDYRLRTLLSYEAALAEKYFAEAHELYNALSLDDRNALIPAQAMSHIYFTILEKIRDAEFNIFSQEYSISNFKKLWFILRARMNTVELPVFPSLAQWGFLKNAENSKSTENPADSEKND